MILLQTDKAIHRITYTSSLSNRYEVQVHGIFFSYILFFNNSRRLRTRSQAEECAGRDAGSPILRLTVVLRRGQSRCDGWQRHCGSRGRVLWPKGSVSSRRAPGSWLHSGVNEPSKRVSTWNINTYWRRQGFHETFSSSPP